MVCCNPKSKAVPNLVAGNVSEARATDTAAYRDIAGNMRYLFRSAALILFQACNRDGAPTLLPVARRFTNTTHTWLVDLEAALFLIRKEWDIFDPTGRAVLVDSALQLVG